MTQNLTYRMAYRPQFTITSSLFSQVEAIAALGGRILGAAVELIWITALQARWGEKVGGKETGRYARRKP